MQYNLIDHTTDFGIHLYTLPCCLCNYEVISARASYGYQT